MPSFAVRVVLFVALMVTYVTFLLSVVEYFEIIPQQSRASIPSTKVLGSAVRASLSSISIPTLPRNTKPVYSPTAISNLYLPSESASKLLRKNRLPETIGSVDIYADPVQICTNMDGCYTFHPSGISPQRSVSSPEPAMTRSGTLVREVIGWVWGIFTKGVKPRSYKQLAAWTNIVSWSQYVCMVEENIG